MPREKEGYREHLEYLVQKIDRSYPDAKGMLSVEQVADILGCNEKTVLNCIHRRSNPLPAVNIASGRKLWKIPVTGLARWTLP